MRTILLLLFSILSLPAQEVHKPYKSYKPYKKIYKPYISYTKSLTKKRFVQIKRKEIKKKDQPSKKNMVIKFLAAIALQESGGRYNARSPYSQAYGKYQFLPSTWKYWVKKYTKAYKIPYNQVIATTPANQHKVAYFKAKTLFKKYKNWKDVASFWYSGRPYFQVVKEGWVNKPQYGGPTVHQYVNSILKKINNN